jgi:hypothetical protein
VGTFHHDKGELHGITVVVDTPGPRVYVGRCDTVTSAGVLLLDADVHEEGQGGRSKTEYLAQAARVGVWKRLDRVVVPSAEVASITPLAALRPR